MYSIPYYCQIFIKHEFLRQIFSKNNLISKFLIAQDDGTDIEFRNVGF